MHRLLITLLLLATFTGCSRPASGPMTAEGNAAPREQRAPADGTRRTLAYQHSIQIDTPESNVAVLHEAALATCRDAYADLCTVLESRISTGAAASASLRFRARPGGIAKLIAALGRRAAITEQSTTAEDLAGPIRDSEKKLAMLTTYRAELEALRGRAETNVDALIKVNHELAEVQGELEAANGKQAGLMQRVDTEILDVGILSNRSRSFWSPVSVAAADFGGSLSQGLSVAITGIAYLLPWGVIFGLAFRIFRTLRRRRQKAG